MSNTIIGILMVAIAVVGLFLITVGAVGWGGAIAFWAIGISLGAFLAVGLDILSKGKDK